MAGIISEFTYENYLINPSREQMIRQYIQMQWASRHLLRAGTNYGYILEVVRNLNKEIIGLCKSYERAKLEMQN